MKCKTVCPTCGEMVRTSSTGAFRHCGAQYNVQANLLAGEQPKYDKMVAKYAAEDEKKGKVEKPAEKIVEKVKEKEAEKTVVEPIIEEKKKVVEPKVEPFRPRKKQKVKSEIVEKVKKEAVVEEGWGFF
jgi:hypothetical protein